MSSAEEFSSNESGWTKYLGSPSQEEGNYSSGVYDDVDECKYYNRYHELVSKKGGGKHKDSDDNDSVASDASSGPSHHEAFIARGNNGGGCSKFRAADEDERRYYGRKQPLGEKPYSEVKGKAAKEPVSDLKAKKGTSLKQKRGKKTN